MPPLWKRLTWTASGFAWDFIDWTLRTLVMTRRGRR